MDVIDRIEDELARHGARLDELRELVDLVGRYLDHVHDDVVSLRQHARLYDPRCYDAAAAETSAPAQEEE